MEEKKFDLIEKNSRRRARDYYLSNPQINNVKLLDREKHVITCECGNYMFKLYKKFGGMTLGKRNKVMNDVPVVYNYVCKCGRRLVLKEDNFSFAKVRYGCSAGKCAFGKTKMGKDCLQCKYIYEK